MYKRQINEFAFAMGALAHYAADNDGHRVAVNPSVGLLYPKLHRKFGAVVTYEDDPKAHLKTEFAFDVLQVARGHYEMCIRDRFVVPLASWACTCEESLPVACQGLNVADAIFVGTVTVAEIVPAANATDPQVLHYRFKVDERFKAAEAREMDVYSGGNDGDCG